MKKVVKKKKDTIELNEINLDNAILVAVRDVTYFLTKYKRTDNWIWIDKNNVGATGTHSTIEKAVRSVWEHDFTVKYITRDELI